MSTDRNPFAVPERPTRREPWGMNDWAKKEAARAAAVDSFTRKMRPTLLASLGAEVAELQIESDKVAKAIRVREAVERLRATLAEEKHKIAERQRQQSLIASLNASGPRPAASTSDADYIDLDACGCEAAAEPGVYTFMPPTTPATNNRRTS
ncbi:MAG: hypothetical protein ABUL47_05700 [Leifsonia sp.]